MVIIKTKNNIGIVQLEKTLEDFLLELGPNIYLFGMDYEVKKSNGVRPTNLNYENSKEILQLIIYYENFILESYFLLEAIYELKEEKDFINVLIKEKSITEKLAYIIASGFHQRKIKQLKEI